MFLLILNLGLLIFLNTILNLFFKFDAQLKLKANIESFDAEKYMNYTNGLMNSSKTQFLDNIRKYLTIVSQIDYKLGEPMQKVNFSFLYHFDLHEVLILT